MFRIQCSEFSVQYLVFRISFVVFRKKLNFIDGKIISAKQRDGIYPYLDETKAAFKEIKRLTLEDFPENKLQFHDDGSFYLN